MKITVPQLAILNLVIQIDKEGKSRQFPIAELKNATDIFTQLKKNVGKDKETGNEIFVDGAVEFTSEQKVLLTKDIAERNWTVVDAPVIFQLQELLK